MILVDTSIWIDHLRFKDDGLEFLLQRREVLVHPFIIGEIAVGNLRQRSIVLEMLSDLPQALVAADYEVLRFIERNTLFGVGIGYVHLLASARLTPDATMWTRDKRLQTEAARRSLTAKWVR